MGKFIDLTGKRFGRLVAIKPFKKEGIIRWECQCDCGNTARPVGATLRNGTSQSCGCARDEWIQGGFRGVNIKHGLFGTKIYGIWAGITTRCYNTKDSSYKSYGARGIKMADEWRHDPVRFHQDVGDPPEGMTLDRIDVNGDYTPSNVRWATYKEQANNKRNNVRLTHEGVTKTLTEWAEAIGMSPSGFRDRLKVMTLGEAITKPNTPKNVKHTLMGENKTINEWAEYAGIEPKTLRQRLKDGWPLEKAIKTPYDPRRNKK